MKFIIPALAIYGSLFPIYMYILFYQQVGKIDFGIPYEPGLISFLLFGFFALILSIILVIFCLATKRRLHIFTYTSLLFCVSTYAILFFDTRDIVGIVLD